MYFPVKGASWVLLEAKKVVMLRIRHFFYKVLLHCMLYPFRPEQNGCHFADDIFKYNFVKNYILIQISHRFAPMGPIDNNSPLVEIIGGMEYATSHCLNQWWPSSQTRVCFTKPQWVKYNLVMGMGVDNQYPLTVIFFTHCGLVTPCGDMELGLHWLR